MQLLPLQREPVGHSPPPPQSMGEQSLATDVELAPRQQPAHTAAARLLPNDPSVKHADSPAEHVMLGIGVALQVMRSVSSFRLQLRPAASFTTRDCGFTSLVSPQAETPKAPSNDETESQRNAVKPTSYHAQGRGGGGGPGSQTLPHSVPKPSGVIVSTFSKTASGSGPVTVASE